MSGSRFWFNWQAHLVLLRVVMLDEMCLLACRSMPCALPRLPQSYTFCPSATADLHRVLEVSEHANNARVDCLYRQFYVSGSQPYIAEFAGRVVAYCWVFFKDYTLTFDSYVRGLVYQMCCCRRMLRLLETCLFAPRPGSKDLVCVYGKVIEQLHSSDPEATILSFVRPENEASMRLHQKLEFLGLWAVLLRCFAVRPLSGVRRVPPIGQGCIGWPRVLK